jgi:hypothetical protein
MCTDVNVEASIFFSPDRAMSSNDGYPGYAENPSHLKPKRAAAIRPRTAEGHELPI